jgi:hypothetical protein
MNLQRKARKPLPPATGKVRWLKQPTMEHFYGRFLIAVQTQRGIVETEYDIAAVKDEEGRIVGLGLAKDDDTIYHIDISQPYGWSCDCASEAFGSRQPGTCKHCQAARQALVACGITLPKPQRQTPAPQCNEFDDP